MARGEARSLRDPTGASGWVRKKRLSLCEQEAVQLKGAVQIPSVAIRSGELRLSPARARDYAAANSAGATNE